jgi:hypothetical protein
MLQLVAKRVRVIREAVKAEQQWSRAHRDVVKPDSVGPDRARLDVIGSARHDVSPRQSRSLVEPDNHLAIEAGLASPADGAPDVVRAKY